MFVTHQRIVPRWKEWVPLATHQLRLRNLIQVLAFSIKYDKNRVRPKEIENKALRKESYYYTLHLTTMSAPFYTSEKLECDSPKWKEIEVASWTGDVCGSADALVIRLWSHVLNDADDQVISVWGIYLSGLTYLGQHLGADTPNLKPNSIVLFMPGGYFTDPNCLELEPKIRFTSISINQNDIRPSYTISLLTRLHTLQQAIKKQSSAAEQLKQKISMGDFFRNETRGRTMLRRLLSKNKPKVNHQELIKVKENIEIAKYRVQILKEEKAIMESKVGELKEKIELMSDTNVRIESTTMEMYRLLMREMHSHKEWKKGHVDRREGQLHSRAMLNFRAKQLISELNLIYPIVEKSSDKFTICGVRLPDSEDFAGHDETQISVALGFVTHVIQMISVFLQVPLRYPVVHFGSRSRIIDQIDDKIPDSEREFPLYLRGKDKLQFHYAVYLLNKNIAQLRWLCGLPTQDLRNTLANLSSLVKMKSGGSNLDPSCRSLSSSTADVSSLSISSPIGSILSLTTKRHPRPYRVSESCVETTVKKSAPLVFQFAPGHRVSKSVGSAKDMMIDVYPISNQSSDMKTDMNNSLSYSLDKGLNEYEESAEPDNLNHVGSEPSLNSSTKVETRTPEVEAKNTFLKTWEAESQRMPFSDDDSDVNNTCVRGSDKDIQDVMEALEEALPVFKPNKSLSENEQTCQPIEQAELNCDTEAVIQSDDTKNCDLDNNLCMSDTLLENVTSRTEALVNQTTSFNRFRTRFKSTVESSN